MTPFLAALPLLCVLVCMAVLHTSAVRAGLAGLALAVGLATGVSGFFSLTEVTGLALGNAAAGTFAEALGSAINIVWIVLPALALYAYQDRLGAIERIRDALTSMTTNRRLQAILLAWFFGLFIEGAAGFGTPVALAAPLLLGIGYSPVRAVTLALLGHASGVSFGAVGTPTLAQIELTGLEPNQIAGQVALMHAMLGWIFLFAMVRIADDRALSRQDVAWTLFAGLAFFLPSLMLAFLAGPELPSLAGALIGAILFIIALRQRATSKLTINVRALTADLAPYLLIVLFILATRLVPPLQDTLSALALDWRLFEHFSGSFAPLYHPGTMLWCGLLLGALITARAQSVPAAARDAISRALPVGLALFIMLLLSRLMVQTGMIAALAEAAAQTGQAWPILSPSVGVLGTFITGSATTSNILFTELQLSTALALDLPVMTMVAAQGFGSAVGNILAPHNIIAGAATVGLIGREGEVMSKTLALGIGVALLGGAAIAIYTRLLL